MTEIALICWRTGWITLALTWGNRMKAVLIEVGGLRPGAPTSSLRRTLTSFPGVINASIDAASRQVTVLYDPDLVTDDDLRSLIERCGIHCISISPGVVFEPCPAGPSEAQVRSDEN